MNKINTLIKTSSMPQLRSASNKKQSKHKHINEITVKNPPSVKVKKDENIMDNLV